MALLAMDAIREAELSAQKAIQSAQKSSEQRIADSQLQADAIISEAKSKVSFEIENSVDRARKKSEEILITSRNSAVLQAEKLRADCAQKQNIVNKKVLELIV